VCDPKGEEEEVDIVVTERRCLLETLAGFPESHNDWWYVRVFMAV